MTRRLMYPRPDHLGTHRIEVDAPHVLHVDEYGTADGIPVVVLHGGPGAGAKPEQLLSFDPTRFRIIQFDQRGCGRATPSAETEGNDTAALVADLERIRTQLKIDKWMVAGGSWGSLLALSYAIAHPERCTALRVHGIFLGSAEEVRHWFHGIGTLFPDAFEDFTAHVPETERDDLLAAYHKRLIDPDPQVHQPAAEALRGFSARTQTFLPSPAHVGALTAPKAALEIARLFTHYCVNAFFQPEDHVLSNIDKIRHIPAEIVQGRYDIVTPMSAAWKLHRAWPEARFTLVAQANHVATRAAADLSVALRAAADRLADGPGLPTIDDYLAPRAHHSPALTEDGTRLYWLSNETGIDQIWALDLEDPSAVPEMVQHLDEPVGAFALRPGSGDLLFTTDSGGDERHQLHLLRAGDATAQALTDAPGVVHQWGAFDQDGARIAFASNPEDATAMQICLRELDSGTERVLRRGPGWRSVRGFRPNSTSLLIEENAEGNFDASLVLLDTEDGSETVLLPGGTKTHINAAKWGDGGGKLFLATDHEAQFHGVVEMDPENSQYSWVAQPEGDVEQLALDKDNARIAYAWNDGGRSVIVIRDRESGNERRFDPPIPGRVTSLAFAPDGQSLVFAVVGFCQPSVIARMSVKDGACEMLCESDTGLAPEDTVEPITETVKSFDGADVPIFVFEPKGPAPEGGRPAFVIVHGGPESQYAAHWRSDVQYLVRRGWVVVAPNVRGSTGYGRDWQAADDLEKRMDSVSDLKAVRDWLAARDDVDADRLVVSGQSYGGFMVLAAITEYPQDWRAAVEFYGIADFNTLMDSTGPWRRKLRAVEYGDPDSEEGRALLYRLSPMRKMAKIETPLFIAHGGDDPRVTPAESELVYANLRGRGHDCVLMRVDHEGHGFVRPQNRQQIYGAMMRFIEERTAPRPAGKAS